MFACKFVLPITHWGIHRTDEMTGLSSLTLAKELTSPVSMPVTMPSFIHLKNLNI